jgi:hypothetical protein
MPNIAVVTSITFEGNNAACFNQGFLSSFGSLPNITANRPADGDYGALRDLIRKAANGNPRPDLIVAAGGLVTALAAAAELSNADPKFVYLGGDALPQNLPAPAFAGGVNIDNPGENQARRKILTDPPFNVDPDKIYIIVNDNNPFSANDASGWGARVASFFVGGNPPDPTTALRNEFTNLRDNSNPAPKGLVISADPYFRRWRTAFTTALGTIVPLPVCYPYKDYTDAIEAEPGKPNKTNSRALELPKLNNHAGAGDPNTAYFQLGKQAGRFVGGTANVQVVKWDAATKKWLPPA